MARQIVIGCDDAACDLKAVLVETLEKMGIEFEDVGVVSSKDKTIYPQVAERVANAIIASGDKKLGILLCGTGIGMCISANKFPGIYAAVCHDSFSSERAKLSNNTNVICMGARVIEPELAKKNLIEWLSLEFKDGSSTPKVNHIKAIERKVMK